MTIIEVLQELGIQYSTPENSRKVRPGWVGTVCPFCGHGGGEAYLGFPIGGRIANCWTCGIHRLGDALAALSGEPISRILPLIRELGADAYPGPKVAPRAKVVQPMGLGPLLAAHERYLRGRRFNPGRLVGLYGIRGLGLAGDLSWRLWIPLTRDGKLLSWTTRLISDADHARRYRSAAPHQEAYPHRDMLLGEDLARHSVIVTEGFFGAARIGPGAVATMGVDYTPAQVARIARFPQRAICFDSEPAAQARARRLCEELEPLPGRTLRVELDGPQPDRCSDKEIKSLRRLLG